MDKVVGSVEAALEGVNDGAVIMSGGFGLSGNPENLITGLHQKGDAQSLAMAELVAPGRA